MGGRNDRNGWSDITEISGQIKVKWVVGLLRNSHLVFQAQPCTKDLSGVGYQRQ